ncbi:MAG TPA: BamA/TamA family outer membrane protein [Candidatus Limnocylindrales bacterium]|nr:BamA/TamA family outer membrane protein [Candidatus Limnocylindrales bacterium]
MLAFVSLSCSGVYGSESTPDPAPSTNAAPDFLYNKPRLPEGLLKDKREGVYVTGFPILGYNPETQFAFGAAAQIFDNGSKDSPFFDLTPYRRRLLIGVTAHTGGFAQAGVEYDVPYVNDSPWRIRGAALIRDYKFENYFGRGERTLEPLSFPGSPETFSSYEDYYDALKRNQDGKTWERYDDYHRTEALGVVTVERDYLGGLLRPQAGLQISHVRVQDYTGDTIDGAVMQETRLHEDYLAGRIVGFDGGWDNALKIGVTYDTRDFEPDPSAGVMLQVVGRFSGTWLGSEFDYQQFTFSAREFFNLLPQPKRLILAFREVYAIQSGDVPFYAAARLPFTDGDKLVLGGYNSLRGYKLSRFAGPVATWANAELRWSFAETRFLKQHLRFMVAPFFDTGRVFDSVKDTTMEKWKVAGGAGFRLAWNLSTVVSFDYGVSSESGFFYMELGHQF